ncbi:MAG: starvation-sensing protein RspA [Acidobacteriaceae bacterium]|nr:starvation-sensing protein RspA [Acidobacteriaceae bacterium]MBV9039268.1 starvation-sensing protein RspA [Acidobacteriaceae bacterium]MBV9222419.1 starvation-sensing protein RspA [Acidobacteriaceae bacterium]MBV9676562.1 starvation-sensing protein RspA [Acidobacteriaceae bacterium]MBV9938042.1 starvation-sensing protein RspA [Acidobacteriaceae bacterium]
MNRRHFAQTALLFAAERYARAARGLPELKITEVRAIPTSAGANYSWVFLKILTSEPGLYGIGSASNINEAPAIVTAIKEQYTPFWIGKNPDRIEDLWQSTNVRTYWRNSTVQNNILSALDMALWDIKGKRAGMPVYELLGGKVRDAVPIYAHADGRDPNEVIENVRQYMDEGYRHVRAQMGGYGGGGMIPAGKGSRPAAGFNGSAFDEDIYLEHIPKLFEQIRAKLGPEVKLLHDVHEHLTPTGAVEFAKRMEPYRMFFVEDILPPEQIDWFRRIKQVTTTPMAMGELFTSPREYVPLISERTIDFVRCRVSQIGGITAAKKIAGLCEDFGVRTAWQEGGDNDPVNQLAAYHVDLTIPSFGIQEENHFPPVVHDLLPGTAQLRGGYLYGNGEPGLGIDVKEEAALKYPLKPLRPGDSWTTVRGMDGSLVKP